VQFAALKYTLRGLGCGALGAFLRIIFFNFAVAFIVLCTISWDGTERKVTVNFNGTTIELWIDKPQAKVNGVMKWIDPNNHNVKPIIVNDRTMLPLRFVAESLGCTVDWNPDTRTITITYGG